MRLLILVAALIASLAAAHYTGTLPAFMKMPALQMPPALQPEAVPMYRWKDARAQTTYGTQPPAGVKAELVDAQGTMSVVPAARIPEPPKQELPEGVTIQQLMTERAIEQATGVR